MTNSIVSIPSSLLESVFPFHLAINSDRKLVHVGKTIQRICPGLSPGSLFEEHFHIQRPTTTLSFASIQTYLQTLIVLQVRSSSALLKGQMIHLPDQNLLLFLGAPWLPDLDALTSSGLFLSDFAVHDPIADYLALLQSQKTAFAETCKLAEQLRQQRADARKVLEREKDLNDLKSRFITTASHGFRTPLGVIASSAGILQDYPLQIDDAMRQKHLERIQSAVSRINELLDDVLTMSYIEAGEVTAHPHPFKLDVFCQQMIEKYRESTSHTFTVTIASELINHVVVLDQNLLNQLLTSLLSNAVKYTPEPGDIIVDLKRKDEQVVFVVQDSGIGIPPEEITSVFEPFYRASNVGSAVGTGLGLAIARHCVDVHGGTIAIASTTGVGTSITVTLPIHCTADVHELSEGSIAC